MFEPAHKFVLGLLVIKSYLLVLAVLFFFQQHISAPLMEFERLKLIKEFKTEPPPSKPAAEGAGDATPPQPLMNQDGTPMAYIDYL